MKTIHLICNAHIDPVWQWTWDEGISAAIATFKSAVNLADEFDYIFCHNESLLYEDVEKKAPDLFKKIVKLVKEGKWVIAGGWYLQPDCMLPSGESIIRQIEVGRKYFSEKFGVTPTVATNYDAFGCSIGLVQILKKCGYKGMLVCRPNGITQFKYPSKFFDWVAPDGSSIVVSYSSSYNSQLGKAAIKIKDFAEGGNTGMLGSVAAGVSTTEDVDYVLWGVGNHGGGPSRKDLADIAALKIDGVKLIHSSPDKLFDDNIRVGGKVETSLTPCMPGCYSSMAKLKAMHKKTESLFYATEKMLAIAEMSGYKADNALLKIAEKKLLLSEFHDILPGTVIDDGEQDGTEMLSMASRIVKDYRSDAFLYLVMREPVAASGEFPVFVFNYLPYEVSTPVEVEFSLADQNWSEEFKFTPRVYLSGEEIECQTVKEKSTLNLDWRKRVIFAAKLRPLGLTRFTIKVEKTPIEKRELPVYDLKKDLIDKSVLLAPAAIESFDDTADPWGMSNEELIELGKNPRAFRPMTDEEAATFCGFDGKIGQTHTIEDGKVVTAVESLYTADKTNALVEYKFYKSEKFVDLKVIVEYGDKNKLVRLKIPAPTGIPVGDGPYVIENKPTKRETYFHKWCGVKTGEGEYFAVINDCLYGGKFEDGFIYLTLLRGAGYCIHPIYDRELYPKDRYLKRIENGRYEYDFRIMRGTIGEIAAEAQLFNEKPYALNVFPTGGGGEYAEVKTDKPVIASVFRKTENGGYEMRFFNPENEEKTFNLTAKGMTREITIKRGEILTVKISDEITVCPDKILD